LEDKEEEITASGKQSDLVGTATDGGQVSGVSETNGGHFLDFLNVFLVEIGFVLVDALKEKFCLFRARLD
jgi:hypothetical protein